MTQEEAIKILSESIHYGSKVSWDKIVEAVHLSIEALSQPPLPSNLDEAAEEFTRNEYSSPCAFGGENIEEWVSRMFKAGAEWQKEHNHDFCLTCEKNRDVVFHKGMQYAIEQMKKDAIELPVKIDAGGYPYIQITGIEFFDYEKDKPTKKEGDVVRILILD